MGTGRGFSFLYSPNLTFVLSSTTYVDSSPGEGVSVEVSPGLLSQGTIHTHNFSSPWHGIKNWPYVRRTSTRNIGTPDSRLPFLTIHCSTVVFPRLHRWEWKDSEVSSHFLKVKRDIEVISVSVGRPSITTVVVVPFPLSVHSTWGPLVWTRSPSPVVLPWSTVGP